MWEEQQELEAQVTALEAENAAMKNMIHKDSFKTDDDLKAENTTLNAEVEDLKNQVKALEEAGKVKTDDDLKADELDSGALWGRLCLVLGGRWLPSDTKYKYDGQQALLCSARSGWTCEQGYVAQLCQRI